MAWMTKIQKMRITSSGSGGSSWMLANPFGGEQEQAYLQMILTNALDGVFDAYSQQVLAGADRFHRVMAGQDSELVARAAIYARGKGIEPRQAVRALAALVNVDRDLFAAAFDRVILRVEDLVELAEALPASPGSSRLDRVVRRAISDWLAELSEEQVLHIAGTPVVVALRRILRSVEARPVNRTQAALFAWLLDPAGWAASDDFRLTPQLAALERIKELAFSHGDRDRALDLIAEGQLPFDVVARVMTPDADAWTGLMYGMPYRDLLAHLIVFRALGILAHANNAAYVGRRLTNPEALQRAAVDPVELFTTLNGFSGAGLGRAEALVAEALVNALEMSFINLPFVGARVALAADVSSSTLGVVAAGRTVLHTIDVVGVLSGALLRANPEGLLLPFAEQVIFSRFSPRDGVLETAARLAEMVRGQAVMAAPVEALLNQGLPIDTLIGITDHGPWISGSGHDRFVLAWEAYRGQIAAAAEAYLVCLAPGRGDGPDSALRGWLAANGVHLIQGWSGRALRYIEMMAGGLSQHQSAIEALRI